MQWEARMLIRDIEKSKSHILNLDLIATQEQQIRIEATTTMGFSVASFAVDKNVVSYYLSSNKKYYKGAVGAQAMQALVGLNIEPHDFIDFIFDQIPGNAAWACQKNTNQELKRCLHKRENLEVLWSKRDNLSKSIEIKSDKASIQLALSSYTEPKSLEANTFLVNKP